MTESNKQPAASDLSASAGSVPTLTKEQAEGFSSLTNQKSNLQHISNTYGLPDNLRIVRSITTTQRDSATTTKHHKPPQTTTRRSMNNNTRPNWLPRGGKRNVKLTSEQYKYILPAFTHCRGSNGHNKPLDGVSLCDNVITGHRLAIKELLKRFEFSDLDVTNLTEATLP